MKTIKEAYYRYLRYFLSKDDDSATVYDRYMALAYAVRSEMVDKWIQTQHYYHTRHPRRVYYISTEYVFGKSLHPKIINLGLLDDVAKLARDVGFSLEELYATEDDFSLGNGGEGRWAAACQESMATSSIPAQGYGIRYDYAQFRQVIVKGIQIEKPYDWLHKGHPWEIVRPEYQCEVTFGGRCEPVDAAQDTPRHPRVWRAAETAVAIPCDVPVPGYRNSTVNTLRLWSARAAEEFPADYANHGEYERACEDTVKAGRLTRILFPEGDIIRATNSRIRQQYFLVSTSLQDILRRHKQFNDSVLNLADEAVIQLSGSRCALAVPEMMRLLVDGERVPWETAWDITRKLFAYTSHTILRENLEKWPVYLLEQILPRHMEIVYEINQQHIDNAPEHFARDLRAIQELSVIEEGEVKRVKMGHLAVLGSSYVNGVSPTQSACLKSCLFPQLVECRPGLIYNITNGASHRRWLLCSNTLLADLVTESIGEGWIREPQRLRELEPFTRDSSFLEKMGEIKEINKARFLISLNRVITCSASTEALFDAQCKRIHSHKRQILHIFTVIHRYLDFLEGRTDIQPRLHLFAGKAVPSDFLGKQIIHLIHIVAGIVNNDQRLGGAIQVAFVPDYGVTWAEKIIPASDVGEEIASAFSEACSTTLFKYLFNGARVITCRGGINEEVIAQVGEENLFLFSDPTRAHLNPYSPYELIENSTILKRLFDFLETTLVATPGGEAVYPLVSTLRDSDRHRVLPDVEEYLSVQAQVDHAYHDRVGWLGCCASALSRAGYFTCDRAIAEYAQTIWKVDRNPS